MIRMPDTQLTPTVPPLTYTVGAWPSNSAPTTGSNVTIFISFRNAGRPVSGAAATAVVRYPNRTARFGPVATASNGYASLSVPAGGVYVGPDHGPASALVSVYVTYLGKTYSTEISFAPLA